MPSSDDTEKRDWLAMIREAADIIDHTINEMHRLASAFEQTGNSHVAEELWRRCAALQTANGYIHKASGAAVSEAVDQSFQSSHNMMMATLAGVAIASKDEAAIKTVTDMVRSGKKLPGEP